MAPLNNICRKIFLSTILRRNGRLGYKLISTSGKKQDIDKTSEEKEAIYRKVPNFAKPLENKNWVSFGFNKDDKDEDTLDLHFATFILFTVFICGSGFLYMYLPTRRRMDWARREAFIRLHEREQLGLELIDPNYVDPSRIQLPPDEELSEEDIVI